MRTATTPIKDRPDRYALESARAEGRREADAGGSCLAPLKYEGNQTLQFAWADGFLSRPLPFFFRSRRRLPLADAWPLAVGANSQKWLRTHWEWRKP